MMNKYLKEIVEGVLTAVIVMVIFLIAVGPKTFTGAIFSILAFSFGAAGIAIGCTKILYGELERWWLGDASTYKKDTDEGNIS